MNVLRRFFRGFPNWVGVLILAAFVLTALFAPLLAPLTVPSRQTETNPAPPKSIMLNALPQPPSREHPLGTLPRSVDILQQLVWGSRQALAFSLKAGIISAVIGVLLGATSAYLGGWASSLVMRLADGMLAVPVITGIVMITQVQQVLLTRIPLAASGSSTGSDLQAQYHAAMLHILSFDATLWAIVLVSWISYARILHAMVISLKNTDYIQAARAMGASPGHIVLRHLIPNAISPAVVLLARDLGWVVILQASLQFAGFGGGESVWGGVLLQSRNWIIGAGGNPFVYGWVWLPATLALVLYGVGWNLVGDGLNDALNPRG
jgi:peptide/nickel transport system permease protein